MSPTPFSGLVLWGAGKPRFLLQETNKSFKLPGDFEYTQGSDDVGTSVSITDWLDPGQIIALDPIGSKRYQVQSLSSSSITLATNFDASPQVLLNNSFTSWSAAPNGHEHPDSWTVQDDTDVGSVNYVSNSGSACRIQSNGTKQVKIAQSILISSKRYRLIINVTVTSGSIKVYAGGGITTINSSGQHTINFVATTSVLEIFRNGVCDVTVSDITCSRFYNQAYSDMNSIWLPDTSDTLLEFQPERKNGGNVEIVLNNGETVYRPDGYRVYLTLSWEALSRTDFKKIVYVWNAFTQGKVLVQPHEDVSIKWDMLPCVGLTPGNPGGLFIGHQLTVRFKSRTLASTIPSLSALGEFHPILN